ncbi:hypothetical protein UCD39_00885 [Nitrospirillum sp. BR 11752]|uniref:hypothetical protein n=1 Tax=Nitrospirillum sp. BR 11752 TaxID=3104293 RepID=UPI002EA0E1C3|nr:hypothetical protein [Nitrospirillum sp. BR 11752]
MPRHCTSIVLVLLALLMGWPARATVPPVPPAAYITLSPQGASLRATYRLDTPVTRLSLGEGPVAWRNPVWRMETPGLVLQNQEVRAADGRAFREFSLLIDEDKRVVDRTYPVMLRLGPQGFLVYGPFLLVRSDSLATGLSQGTIPTEPAGGRALEGYFFVGPAGYVRPIDAVHPGLGRLVARPDLPAAWRDEVAPGLARALAYYRARLSPRGNTVSPIIVYQDQPAPFLRGSVTGGGVMLLQVGGVWRVPRLELKPERDRVLAHETFHLFLRRHDNADFPDWMNEGAADYAAGLVMRHGALPSLPEVQIQLDLCVTSLGDRPLDNPATTARNRMPYACGFVAHWLVDKALRRTGKPDDTGLFALWADMTAHDGVSAGDSLRQAVAGSPAATRALSLLLTGGGPERWTNWADSLAGLGVSARWVDTGAPSADEVLEHVLKQSCTGTHGFWRGARYTLDTGDRCGPLSGDPVVTGMEGHALAGDAMALFQAVVARCAAGQDVALNRPDGAPPLSAPCHVPPPPSRALRLDPLP